MLLSEGHTFRWSYCTNSLKYPLWIFYVNPNVTRFVTYLLARETLTHILTNTATNDWPGMAFLYSRDHLCNSLVAHGIMSTNQTFMLVHLRLYDHARMFVQWTLLRWILHTKDSGLLTNLFFCERAVVFGEKIS